MGSSTISTATAVPTTTTATASPDDNDGNGVPDARTVPTECVQGEGGTLPETLTLQQISVLLSDVYDAETGIPDTNGDGFPDIPRLTDAGGADIGPDWDVLDRLLGEPGDRDLLQLPDNQINEILLEQEDINNVEFVDPDTGEIRSGRERRKHWRRHSNRSTGRAATRD